MSTEFITLIGVLGAPILGVIIYLFNRRATLRGMDTTSDATMVASASEVVKILQSQNKMQEDQISSLNTRLINAEAARIGDQNDFTSRLRVAHEESERTNTIIAKLQNDLDVTKKQIELLKTYLPSEMQVKLQDDPGHSQ